MKVPTIYFGVVLDRANDKVVLASCGEDSVKVMREANDRFPGLPVHELRLLEDPATVKDRLFQFLAWNGVPQEEYVEIMTAIIDGIRESSNGTIPEEKIIDT